MNAPLDATAIGMDRGTVAFRLKRVFYAGK